MQHGRTDRRGSLVGLDVPLVGNPLKDLNSYLILGERNLLIDTGFCQKPCWEAIERQLAEIGVDRSRMDIFLTHLHADHTGLAPELIRPGCQIYISRIDGERMEAECDEAVWRAVYGEYVREGFSLVEMETLWNSNPAPYCEYVLLEDGEALRYGGHTLQSVLTPGHTPGQMCLYEPYAGELFFGDHVLFHITPKICQCGGVSDSLGDCLNSLRKMRDLPVEQLFPVHRIEWGERC